MAAIMLLHHYLLCCQRHHQPLLRGLRQCVARAAWRQAQDICHHLCAHLDSRFHDEETLLYPLLAPHATQQDGPTTVLRYEHDELREQLETLFQAVCRHDARACLIQLRALQTLLQAHNVREGTVLTALCPPTSAHLAQLLRQARSNSGGQP